MYTFQASHAEGTQWLEAEQILLTALIEYLSFLLEYLNLYNIINKSMQHFAYSIKIGIHNRLLNW